MLNDPLLNSSLMCVIYDYKCLKSFVSFSVSFTKVSNKNSSWAKKRFHLLSLKLGKLKQKCGRHWPLVLRGFRTTPLVSTHCCQNKLFSSKIPISNFKYKSLKILYSSQFSNSSKKSNFEISLNFKLFMKYFSFFGSNILKQFLNLKFLKSSLGI